MLGGSTDGTVDYANYHGYPIFVQWTPGLGTACIEGLVRATEDVTVTYSLDGNSYASRLPDTIENMRAGYNTFIISRYLDWAKSDDDDFITGFGNWMFTKIFNIFFKDEVIDLLVIYRVFQKDLANELNVDHGSISWTT